MEVFNRSLALARLGGDEALLERKLNELCRSLPEEIRRLERALTKEGDAYPIAEAIHRSVAEVGAEGMEALASRVAEAIEAHDRDRALAEIPKMEMELEWLRRVLDKTRCSGNL